MSVKKPKLKKETKKTTKKKIAPKKTRKPSTRTKKVVNKKVVTPKKEKIEKKEIEKMEKTTEKIPALIIEEKKEKKIDMPKPKIHRVPTRPPVAPIYHPPRHGKKWLWVAVIIFSAVVFGMWGLNIVTFISSAQNADDPTKSIIQTGRENLTNIANTFESQEEKFQKITDETKEMITEESDRQVEETLRNTLRPLFANVTSTTSTVQISTTTPTTTLELE